MARLGRSFPQRHQVFGYAPAEVPPAPTPQPPIGNRFGAMSGGRHMRSTPMTVSPLPVRSYFVAPVYQQVMTAALSFAGSLPRRVTPQLTSVLSLAGTTLRAVAHSLTGSTSFAGTANIRGGKSLSGSLPLTGSIPVRIATRAMAAALSPSGSLRSDIRTSLSSALSFTGLTPRQVTRALTSNLSFTGVQTGAKFFEGIIRIVAYLKSQLRISTSVTPTSDSRGDVTPNERIETDVL